MNTERQSRRQPRLLTALAAAAGLAALAPAALALGAANRIVLQKDRHFAPGDLFVRLGDALTLVNGDPALVHHPFIEASQFSFDPGDQEPGSEARLIFTKRGDFIVQCGIHPKMKLTVHVQ